MSSPLEIVLTGGPCAGKSTVLAEMSGFLDGFRVLTAPEAASIVIGGGVDDINSFASANPVAYKAIEEQIMLIQGDLRRRFQALADIFPEPSCIIYDRAELDAVSYMSEDQAKAVLAKQNRTIESARDSYDAVIHLRTAARAGYYDFHNQARREDASEALLSDQRTLETWCGHPRFFVVEAKDDFQTKLDEVRSIIRHLTVTGF